MKIPVLTYNWHIRDSTSSPFTLYDVKYRKSKRCDRDIDILLNVYPRGNFYYDGIVESFKYSNGIKAVIINKSAQICIQTATVAWHTRSTLCPHEYDERKTITYGNMLVRATSLKFTSLKYNFFQQLFLRFISLHERLEDVARKRSSCEMRAKLIHTYFRGLIVQREDVAK